MTTAAADTGKGQKREGYVCVCIHMCTCTYTHLDACNRYTISAYIKSYIMRVYTRRENSTDIVEY